MLSEKLLSAYFQEKTMSSLPGYVASAKSVPQANRAAWYKNVAQTYAGIMLWFVFWQDIVKGGASRAACYRRAWERHC